LKKKVIKEIHSNGVDIKKKGRGSKTPIFTLLLSFSVALFTFYLPLSFIDFTLPFAELLGLARYQVLFIYFLNYFFDINY